MKLLSLAWIALGVFLFTVFAPFSSISAQGTTSTTAPTDGAVIYMFGRDDCGFCKAQSEFLEEEGLPYVYLNIRDSEE